MTANSNSLPISVVSAVVARFDGNHDEIRFHGNNEFRIHIDSWEHDPATDSWNISATWISGAPMRITVDAYNFISSWSVFDDGKWCEGS